MTEEKWPHFCKIPQTAWRGSFQLEEWQRHELNTPEVAKLQMVTAPELTQGHVICPAEDNPKCTSGSFEVHYYEGEKSRETRESQSKHLSEKKILLHI